MGHFAKCRHFPDFRKTRNFAKMSMTSMDGMRSNIAKMLRGIERYNPENIPTLERYVEVQSRENGYDLEANLALLKLYQFNPTCFQTATVCQILMKALTNLPHSDFVLCKCLLSQENLEEPAVKQIQYLHDLLETAQFKVFWQKLHQLSPDLVRCVSGFEDSIRKFVCHVISITYQNIQEETLCELLGLVDETIVNQWIAKNGWKSDNEKGSPYVLITNQEESIKTKKITEKIDLESVAGIMASCY